jgi:hypothetical protein
MYLLQLLEWHPVLDHVSESPPLLVLFVVEPFRFLGSKNDEWMLMMVVQLYDGEFHCCC